MNELFDKIFFINLEERKDRLVQILKEFEKMGIKNFERVEGIRPTINFLKENNILYSNLKYWNRNNDYVIGSVGRKLSHYNVIKIAKERGYKKILILEDDIFFTHTKEETVKILKSLSQEDSNMIYLGGNDLSNLRIIETNCKYLRRVYDMYFTHAYIINSNIYDYVLENLQNYNSELDTFYVEKIQTHGKCYKTVPYLVDQKFGFSDILKENKNYSSLG